MRNHTAGGRGSARLAGRRLQMIPSPVRPLMSNMRISVALALLLVACGGNNQDVKTSTGNGGSSALGSSGAGAGPGGSPNMPGAGSGTMPGAGTGATDPHPPHVVGKCDGLGKVGEWEEISPPEMI